MHESRYQHTAIAAVVSAHFRYPVFVQSPAPLCLSTHPHTCHASTPDTGTQVLHHVWFLSQATCPFTQVSSTSSFINTWLVGYSAVLGPVIGIVMADYFLVGTM